MKADNPTETCTATNRQKKRCARRPIPGGKVCAMHGGKAPQVVAAAKLRLAALVDPAIRVLAYAMNRKGKALPQALQAANSVLDRTGHGTKQTVELEGSLSVAEVLRARRQKRQEQAP